MGNTNLKLNDVTGWTGPCTVFIKQYLAKKHCTIDNNIDYSESNYNMIKTNPALVYINGMAEELQNALFIMSDMGPNLSAADVTFKEEQRLLMLELLYEQKFIEFLEEKSKTMKLKLDTKGITVNYDIQVIENKLSSNTTTIKNIKIIIELENYPSYLTYDIVA